MFLAAACVVLGAGAGVVVPALTRLAPMPVAIGTGASLHIPGTGMLPALPLVVVLAALVLVFALLRRTSPAVAAPTWISGQPQDDRLAWSSAGFTKPLRLVLEPLLRPERAVTTVSNGALVQSIEYRSVTPHLFDTLIFSPLERVSLRGAHVARRLQSGSLRMYVAYLLVLVLGLLAAARLGLIG